MAAAREQGTHAGERRLPAPQLSWEDRAINVGKAFAEHVAQGGKRPKEDGDFEQFSQQAGYLIGVQVGRWLGAKTLART
jgi:hypothetical protein